MSIVFSPEFLASIAPAVHPRYSPNLHRWLEKHSGKLPEMGVYTSCVGSTKAGHFFVGMVTHRTQGVPSSNLKGRHLMTILKRQKNESLPRPMSHWREWTPVEDFWEHYQQIGRCALDPTHDMWFIREAENTRWIVAEDGKSKACQWCGKVFEKQVVYRPEKIWVDVAAREERLESACARMQAEKERGWEIARDIGWEKSMRVLKKRGLPTLEKLSFDRSSVSVRGELVNAEVGHVYAASCWNGDWEAWGVTPAGEHWQQPGRVRKAEIEARLQKENKDGK